MLPHPQRAHTHHLQDEPSRTLDTEVHPHHDHTVELRRQQNDTQPLFTLPTELIRKIFLCSFDDTKPAEDVLSPSSHFKAIFTESSGRSHWAPLSEACHGLRTIALNFPYLWCTIDCSQTKYAEVALSRTNGQPLTLIASLSKQFSLGTPLSNTDAATLALLGQYIPRARCLVLSGFNPTFPAHVSTLSSPLPTLEALAVSGAMSNRPFVLSSKFLGEHAPRLTTLRLSHCAFALVTTEEGVRIPAVLGGVTTLELDDVRFSVADNPWPLSINAFVGVLELMPHLRKLKVQRLQLTVLSAQQHPHRIVHLPELESLQVHEGMETVVNLLDWLPRPTTRLEVMADAHLLPAAHTLVPRLMQHLDTYSFPLDRRSGTASANRLIIHTRAFSPCISVSFHASSPFSGAPSVTHSFDVTVKAGFELTIAAPYISACHTLELDFGRRMDGTAILKALWLQPELPELRTVVVRGAHNGALASRELQEWLSMRRDAGRARVEEIRFVSCGGFASPGFKEGLVGVVRWEEK